MKRSYLKAALTCFGFFLFSTTALYAQQYGEIVGELHVARGDFPGRVLVELQLHSAAIASQYTDEQGKFAFGSLTSVPVVRHHLTENQVQAGFSYKFDSLAPAPVVAKY